MAIVTDLIQESDLRITYTNQELVRVFLVDGLTPSATILYDAVAALGTLSPPVTFGSVLPGTLMVADDFHPKPFLNSKTQAKVYVTYHPINFSPIYAPVVTFSGSSREILTNYKENGNLIRVNYKPGASTDPGVHSADADGISTAIGQVTRNKAFGILEIEKVEYEDPTPKLQYIDAINKDFFWGQPKWTWLVRDIVIRKVFYTSGFNVRYVLEYDWQTHIKTATYRNIVGDIPSDVNTNNDLTVASGNGWANNRVNPEKNFSGLNLPNGFA